MKANWLVAASAAALLIACSPAEDAAHSAPETETAPVLAPDETGFGVAGAMIRPPPGGRDVTAGYFDIVSANDDALVAASSPAVSSIELHTHIDEDGVMVMKKLDEIGLPAGQVVSFKPKGLHLMMFGADGLEMGQDVEVVLEFASGASKTMTFVVKDPLIGMIGEH